MIGPQIATASNSGFCSATLALLCLDSLEVQVANLMAAQIDALIGQEVPDRAEGVVAVVIGADFDQRAVDVEGDRGDVHDAVQPLEVNV